MKGYPAETASKRKTGSRERESERAKAAVQNVRFSHPNPLQITPHSVNWNSFNRVNYIRKRATCPDAPILFSSVRRAPDRVVTKVGVDAAPDP